MARVGCESRRSLKPQSSARRVGRPITPAATTAPEAPLLFPYRPRPGQESILREVAELGHRGGALLVNAPTGSGKTVATLAPLLEHAVRADHRILYLVRTHSQEVQVLHETRAIAHRLDRPILAIGLQGRARRCFLLENVAEVKGATAEEHGKLCADRKRATERAIQGEAPLVPPPELPEGGEIDLTDLDGCPYYARVLQTDLDGLIERFQTQLPLPHEFEKYSRDENLCPYELSKKLVPHARLVTAPYAFFFHPHIRRSLLQWMGVGPERVDLVVDEAHNLPNHLRELTTVALPQESVRRARAEIADRGDFQLPDGPSASRFFDIVAAAVEELIHAVVREEDAILPPSVFEDALLTALGGTSHRLDTWLGALATWGENLRDERRRERHLPRSWVHTVALTLLSWPQLDAPTYVKVATRSPRPALEAFALDASGPAKPILDCHLSVHLSGTLAPLEEYRDSLGLGTTARLLDVPSYFPPENRKFLYDPSVTTRFEEIRNDPRAIQRLADRLVEVLESLPVKTAVFFPSFDLLQKVLEAGLQSQLPGNVFIEYSRIPMGDLWRSIEGWKKDPEGTVLLGVAGGRLSEGIDYPDEELEAVVMVGIPYPKPTAKREALRAYLDSTTGKGWEYTVEAPAQRAILQACGRMIRSENDRGIAIVLDRRATSFAKVLPGLAPVGDLAATTRSFYGRRARWSRSATPAPGASRAVPGPELDPPNG
ncbi:MAG TPA: ATP-dependent DNA helicase [Thermoplasmata archaeon]|nr:ATP-dependent DNA helicase [Thermoplasmata archaeon]